MTYDPYTYWNLPRNRVRWMPDIAPTEAMAFTEWLDAETSALSGIRPPESILEVGSGAGRVYQLLGEAWQHLYTSCDLSQLMCDRFLQMFGNVPAQASGLALPYKDQQFDLVVSWDVLLHVPPDSTKAFVAEHLRVCGRWLYIATYSASPARLAPHCFAHDNAEILGSLDVWKLTTVADFCTRAHYCLERADV